MAIWLKIDIEGGSPVTDTPDFSGLAGHGSSEDQAGDAIRAVVAWYNAQIVAEHRAPLPDEERTAELKAARQGAIEDQQRLADAEPAEVERLSALYAAKLAELTSP